MEYYVPNPFEWEYNVQAQTAYFPCTFPKPKSEMAPELIRASGAAATARGEARYEEK